MDRGWFTVASSGLANGQRAHPLAAILSRGIVLLPGRFDTERLRQTLAFAASSGGHAVEDETARALSQIPAGRLGAPEEFGAVAAFLCSRHAGYITG